MSGVGQLQRLPRARPVRERTRLERPAAIADLRRLYWFPPAILTSGTRDLFLSLTVLIPIPDRFESNPTLAERCLDSGNDAVAHSSGMTHRKLRCAGVEAELQVYEGMSHAQYNFDPCAPEPRKSSPRSRASSMSTPANRASKRCGAARTNERSTETIGFIASYHRGFWASKELSSVRAAMTNLCSHFVDPSNQSQTTQSPSTAVTVITGPPELRRTVSPGLKGIFDSPAAS
jgi:hypothetical protein